MKMKYSIFLSREKIFRCLHWKIFRTSRVLNSPTPFPAKGRGCKTQKIFSQLRTREMKLFYGNFCLIFRRKFPKLLAQKVFQRSPSEFFCTQRGPIPPSGFGPRRFSATQLPLVPPMEDANGRCHPSGPRFVAPTSNTDPNWDMCFCPPGRSQPKGSRPNQVCVPPPAVLF